MDGLNESLGALAKLNEDAVLVAAFSPVAGAPKLRGLNVDCRSKQLGD